MSEKVLILGAGYFGEEVAEIMALNNHEVIAFVEGIDRNRCLEYTLSKPLVWIDDLPRYPSIIKCVAAIGSVKRKKIIDQASGYGFGFITSIHPAAHIASTAFIDTGVIINAASVVSSMTLIKEHVIINRGCMIGHHVTIGSYTTISPGANIAGKVTIGDFCYIGIGAIILDGIKIGSNSIIGAGAVVTKDVPENVQVFGVPARIIKKLG